MIKDNNPDEVEQQQSDGIDNNDHEFNIDELF